MSAVSDAPEAPAEAEAELLPVEKEAAKLHEQVMAQIAKIEPQYKRLVALRDRLDGNTSNSTPAPAPARAPKRSAGGGGGNRSGKGTRLDQFMEAVRAEPGQEIPHYAEKIGIEPNYLYRVREKAQAANLIKVEGRSIHPVEQEAVAA